MSKDEYFIEPRPDGGFAVKKPNAERASAVTDTQAEAIARAKALNPEATIHIARVKHTSKGHPDQFRKK